MLPNVISQLSQKSWSAEDFQNLAEELSESVVLVHLSIGWWRGMFELKDSAVVIDGQSIPTDSRVKPGKVRVMDDEFRLKFTNVEAELRRTVAVHSIEIKKYQVFKNSEGAMVREARVVKEDKIIPKNFKDKVKNEVERIKTEKWDPLVNRFADQFSEMVAKFKKDYPLPYKQIEKYLPASGLEAKAKFNVWYCPTNLGYRADDLTREALEAGAGEYLLNIRESIFRQAIDSLKDEAQKVMNILNKEGGKIRTATIENLSNALSLFKSVGNLIPNGDLMPLIVQAEELVNNTDSRELNSKAARDTANAVTDVLKQVSDALDSDNMLATVNKKRRRIAI